MKNKKIKKKLTYILLVVFISLFIVSAYNIIIWFIDNKKTNDEIKNINKHVYVSEVKDSEETEIINPESNPKDSLYWNYINVNLIDVDIKSLIESNKNTVGWLKVEGTNINYPFVQTTDNEYYLKHSFYNKTNSAGWVFLDYRNNIESEEKNTIIYGHGRVDGSVFGTLKSTVKESWFKNTNNRIIKLSTLHENSLWQVFSSYTIPTTNDYIQVSFQSDDEYTAFLEKLQNRSFFNYEVSLTKDDRILTLSSCYNQTDKVVVHAKLIKRDFK